MGEWKGCADIFAPDGILPSREGARAVPCAPRKPGRCSGRGVWSEAFRTGPAAVPPRTQRRRRPSLSCSAGREYELAIQTPGARGSVRERRSPQRTHRMSGRRVTGASLLAGADSEDVWPVEHKLTTADRADVMRISLKFAGVGLQVPQKVPPGFESELLECLLPPRLRPTEQDRRTGLLKCQHTILGKLVSRDDSEPPSLSVEEPPEEACPRFALLPAKPDEYAGQPHTVFAN